MSTASPTPHLPPWRTEIWLLVIVGAAFLLIVVVGVVRSADDVDRGAAIQRAVDASAGRLTDQQAACYVDGVRDQVGGRYLAPGATVPDDVAARMTSIRVDCVGVTNLGVSTTVDPDSSESSPTPATEAGNLPRAKGDDPTLDALYDQCALGSGQACDDLFDLAPVASAYESFAITCGNRTIERRCADVYVLPTAPPAPASAGSTPTEPPPS